MNGPLSSFFVRDHRRLDALLKKAVADGHVDARPYAEFRAGILRHIGMEERILIPAARRARGGQALPIARLLRLDHGAIAALLVPPPRPEIIERTPRCSSHTTKPRSGPTACMPFATSCRGRSRGVARQPAGLPGGPSRPAPGWAKRPPPHRADAGPSASGLDRSDGVARRPAPACEPLGRTTIAVGSWPRQMECVWKRRCSAKSNATGPTEHVHVMSTGSGRGAAVYVSRPA